MAFVKKTWKDRIVQYANRRLLTKSGGEVEQVTVTRDEGTVSVAGDKFDAATMNDLETRVDDGFSDMKDYIDNKTNTLNGIFTPGTNVTVLRSTLIKIGNLKILSVIFQRTGVANVLGTVSTGFEATYNYDFIATKDYSAGVRMRINQSNSIVFSTTPDANEYYAFTLAYV